MVRISGDRTIPLRVGDLALDDKDLRGDARLTFAVIR